MTKIDESDLSLFFDLSLEMLCIAGTDGYFRKLNPIWEETLGYTREELKAHPFVNFVHPDDVGPTVQEVMRLSEGLSVVNFENRYKHKNGEWRWLSWKASAHPNGTIYATARDITENKMQEQKLRKSESLLMSFLEALPIAIYILGADGLPYYANHLSGEILGKGVMPDATPSQLSETYQAYKSSTDVLYPENELPVVRALQGKSAHIDDMEIVRPDGRIPIEIWAKPVRNQAGEVEYAIAGFVDISERRVQETEMAKLMADLERSNQDLDQFAYVVSHDLKAPLRAITSLSEWIAEDLAESSNPEVIKQLKMLRERVALMQSLIRDLLEYGRIGRARKKLEKVDLNDLVANISEAIPRPETFTIRVPEKLPILKGDRTELFQLFSNLIGNAVNYRKKENGWVEIRSSTNDGMLEFSIADNGIGIDPRFHEKIFEIFERIGESKEAEGTGIGLAMVKRLVQENGGEISLESKPGKGATFIFTWNIPE